MSGRFFPAFVFSKTKTKKKTIERKEDKEQAGLDFYNLELIVHDAHISRFLRRISDFFSKMQTKKKTIKTKIESKQVLIFIIWIWLRSHFIPHPQKIAEGFCKCQEDAYEPWWCDPRL